MGFAKSLRAPFLAEHLRWLLLERNCRNTDQYNKHVLNKIKKTNKKLIKNSVPEKTKMAPDADFELMSYNPFTVNDNFLNSDSDPDISFYSDISPLNTKYFSPKEIREGFKCLCKNGFSVLHVNIRSINKNFETF